MSIRFIRKMLIVFLSLCSLYSIYSMENSTSLNKYDDTKTQALSSAIQTAQYTNYSPEHFEQIKKYIKDGADPNICSTSKETPLYVLLHTFKDNPEQFDKELQDLIKHGLDINKYIDGTETVVHCVIKPQFFPEWKSLLNSLIKHGANVNKKTESGYTPLARAMINDIIDRKDKKKQLLLGNAQLFDLNPNEENIFHYLAKNYLTSVTTTMQTIVTHANFNYCDNQEKQTIIKALWAFKYAQPELSQDLQFLILSKFLEESDFFHIGLHKKLIARGGYDGIRLIPVNKQVEYLIRVLNIPDIIGNTALDSLKQRSYQQNPPNYIKILFDGTKLQQNLDALNHNPNLDDPKNLALAIYNAKYKFIKEK